MLEVTSVFKQYPTPRGPLPVLADVSLSLARGDAVAITGPSGRGKSTLVLLLGGLEPPSAGRVSLNGTDLYALGARRRAAFRNRSIGCLFQHHGLLPQCSVLENVLAPTLVGAREGESDDQVIARARALLEQVGLRDRLDHRPADLTRDERQRAALARALIRNPALLVCDEPTGSLDQASAGAMTALLLDLYAAHQTMLVVATHSEEVARRLPVRYELVGRTLLRT